jgi:hypothetical protein
MLSAQRRELDETGSRLEISPQNSITALHRRFLVSRFKFTLLPERNFNECICSSPNLGIVN